MKVGDKVNIIPLEVTGRIKAIYQDRDGVQYVVRYFYEGTAKEVYFYPDELNNKIKGEREAIFK